MAEDVFDVLKKEHKEIKRLLGEAEKDPRRFSEFSEEVDRHVHAEEQVLYMPYKDEQKLHEMILEGFEEHHVVSTIIKEMDGETAGSDEWAAKLTVMSENLEHHIDEEEKELFPAAEKLVGRDRAMEMARQYSSAEQELVGSAGRS